MANFLEKARKIVGGKLTLEEAMKLQDELAEKIEEKKEEIKETDSNSQENKNESENKKMENGEASEKQKETKTIEPITKEDYEEALKRIEEYNALQAKAASNTSIENENAGSKTKSSNSSVEDINKL